MQNPLLPRLLRSRCRVLALSHILEMRSGAVKNQKYRYCRTRRGRTLEEQSAKAAATHFSPAISVAPSNAPEIRHSERKSDIYKGAAISLKGRFVKVSLPILGHLAHGGRGISAMDTGVR
jgi:hypothetical protein